MSPQPASGIDAAGVATFASPWPFAETVERLLSALAAKGLKVFGVIDQRAEALAAGLELPPTTLILFGNPRAGTPVMAARPAAGLDLPLKVLVTEDAPGTVAVRMNRASYLVERHGLPAALTANLEPAERLVESALRA